MNKQLVTDKISEILAIFGRKMTILNANNELSWNSLSETIFIPVLNQALDCNFVNQNIRGNMNTPAIDLVDPDNKVAVQVTSVDTFQKVKKTVSGFLDHSLDEEFDRLYIFVLTEKKGFVVSNAQREQLRDILQDRFDFNCSNHIIDFSKLYGLLVKVPVDQLMELGIHLEKELGILSDKLVKTSPAVTVLFDDSIVELAFQVVKGLLECDLRIRYFSEALQRKLDSSSIDTTYCQRLLDVSNTSSATLILSTLNYVTKIENGLVNDPEIQTLKNQHLKHVLIKLDNKSSFRKFDWIRPIVRRGVEDKVNAIITLASNELHKVNSVIEIQDYSDFETIIKLYDNKANFGKEIFHTDPKKKTGYKLLPATDSLTGVTTNYLFLLKGCSIKPTADIFFNQNPKLRSGRDSIILLLPKERYQIRLLDRLKNAEKAFKPNKAFYIDDFISEFCSKGLIEDDTDIKFSSTKNFIQPELKAIEGELSDFDQIENWILSEHDPILVITGGGGIGKTTLAREIADTYYRINTNANIVFIEASDPGVIRNLSRLSDKGQIDLYDFYSAIDPFKKVSRELFRVTIDNGNLMLIIDGLDEVFSRVQDFDVEYFINSVNNDFVKEIGVGKVLLTCRTYFWKEQISKENSINHFEIEPFRIEHATSFYEKKFSDRKLVNKSISLLKETDIEKSDNRRYLPFVVDIIGEIIFSDGGLITTQGAFEVDYLDLDKEVDFIVYRLLKREQIKTGVDINSQIQFLVDIAVKHNGSLKNDNFLDEFTLDNSDGQGISNSLKSHPIITLTDRNIEFKYDFFELYFKALFISDLISLESDKAINEQVISILLKEGRFGSSLFHEVTKRNAKSWNEDNILKIVSLMEDAQQINIPSIKDASGLKHQVKSSFFALALTINQSRHNNQTKSNTDLLKEMFGTNQVVKELSLVNFIILEGNIKFDFSGLVFKDCYFDSYESFWECKFDFSTRFLDCTFYNMPEYSRSNSRGINRGSFTNPKHDGTFENYFKDYEQSSASYREKLVHSFGKYLRLFYANGMIKDKDNKSTIRAKYHPSDKSILPIELIEKKLTGADLLSINFDKVRGENVASIKSEFRVDVFKFLQEGVETTTMKSLLDGMLADLTE